MIISFFTSVSSLFFSHLFSKYLVFQTQLSEGKFALLSCEELLDFANQTLTITNEEEFLKVGGMRMNRSDLDGNKLILK